MLTKHKDDLIYWLSDRDYVAFSYAPEDKNDMDEKRYGAFIGAFRDARELDSYEEGDDAIIVEIHSYENPYFNVLLDEKDLESMELDKSGHQVKIVANGRVWHMSAMSYEVAGPNLRKASSEEKNNKG